MRDQRLGVQLALRNKLQDLSAVTAIHTARFKCQIFAVHFRQRQYLAAIIQRNDGDHGVWARALPGQTECLLRARSSSTTSAPPWLLLARTNSKRMNRFHRQDLRIMLPYKAQARRVLFTDNNTGRPFQQCAQQRTDACRPAPIMSTVSSGPISEMRTAQKPWPARRPPKEPGGR